MTYDDLYREWLSDSPHIQAHTSGSTGKPKTICLDKGLVRRSALRTIRRFSLSSTSHLHSCIYPDFIGGKMMMIRALICGARFTFESPSNTPHIVLEPDEEIDLVSVVPSQMQFIADNIDNFPNVHRFLVGGSAVPPSLAKKISDKGIEAYESYGMTETASHIAVRRISDRSQPFNTLPGVYVECDERGCLVINLGEDGTFVTNDLVSFVGEDNRAFNICGRVDDVIITGGRKVNPVELEKILSPFFPTENICVTYRDDELWGQKIVLLIETNRNINLEELRTDIGRLMPAWQVPKEIISVESLPRTANGKIKRLPLK